MTGEAVRNKPKSSRDPRGTKGLFDRPAERGITLPNEQAQSSGISLCSGCSVAAAASAVCLAHPVGSSLGTWCSVFR